MPKNMKKKKILLIVLCLSVFILFIGFFYFKNIYPKQIMNFGKKYFEIKQYEKALRLFKYAEKLQPNEQTPLYYEVLTLAKMPPVYENQKRLYEISQYDNCDEISNLANDIIADFLKQIYMQAGDNYIDNAMFDNKILRWNNNLPIKYSIEENKFATDEVKNTISNAFKEWQFTTNGEYKFKKSSVNPNIVIHFVNELPEKDNLAAVTVPDVKDNTLNRMDIYIKTGEYSNVRLYSILLHQIGHALGIGSHSINKNDVMYFDNQNASISKRDLNTLTILYKTMPDAINIKINDKEKDNLLYPKIMTMYIGENYTNEIDKKVKQNKNADKLYKQALSYMKMGQYSRANYILESILNLYSDKFDIYYNIALNNYRMKKYRSSLKNLKLAEKIKINDDTKMLRAFLLVKAGNIKEAEKILTALLKENPKNTEIALKLAEIYLKEGKKREYKQIFSKINKNFNGKSTLQFYF